MYNDLLFQRFEHLARLLQAYLTDTVLSQHAVAHSIAQRFQDVLECCDSISYNEPGTVEAYTILHFLDRYHRFQRVYAFLVERNIFPIQTNRKKQILDIGTGPAPALYAVSDMYNLINIFGQDKDIESLRNLQFQSDYVERSDSFRHWLHCFTEYVNYHSDTYPWHVPYHHGNFHDFQGIQLKRAIYRHNLLTSYVYREINLSYDIIILSNFLTDESQLETFREAIHQSVLRLRNGGLLVVVGAREQHYPALYDHLTHLIEHGDYNNHKFRAACTKVAEIDLRYSFSDRFGMRIKSVLQTVLNRLQDLEVAYHIPEKTRTRLYKSVQDTYDKSIAWRTIIFRKQSFVKYRRPKPTNYIQ